MALDPSKLQLQSTLIQPLQPQKKVEPVAQKKTEIAPVQSSLPQMQPSQAQVAPATGAQVASAKKDPRFAQAIASKYQTELQQRQQQLQQQQQQYQQKIQEAGVTGDSGRVSSLLQTITAETDPAKIQQAEQEYQALMGAQAGVVQEPEEYKRAQAKLAALARMSGAGIAKLYGESAPGVIAPETYYRISSPELEQQRVLGKSALREAEQKSIITEAMKQANIQEAEALRGLAKEKITGAEQSLMAGLRKQQEKDVKVKEEAQKLLKESVYLGKPLSEDDISFISNQLGLNEEELSNIGYMDTKDIEGLEKFGPTGTLDELKNTIKKMQTSSVPLTEEQQRFVNYYKEFETGLSRTQDLDALAYATPEQKAQINALKRLTGQTELSKEQEEKLGKGRESGKLSDLSKFKTTSADLVPEQKEILDRINKALSGIETGIAFDVPYSGEKLNVADLLLKQTDPFLQEKGRQLKEQAAVPISLFGTEPIQIASGLNIIDEVRNYLKQRSPIYKKGIKKLPSGKK